MNGERILSGALTKSDHQDLISISPSFCGGPRTAALLIRTSADPYSFFIFAKAASTETSSLISVGITSVSTFGSMALISAAVSARLDAERAMRTRALAPALAKEAAKPLRPIPLLAPVMTMTFPACDVESAGELGSTAG